jgi:hypothetical protein
MHRRRALCGETTPRRRVLAPAPVGAVLLLVLAAPARSPAQDLLPPAEQYTVRLEYLWWSPTPSGQIQKGLGDFEGTLLDIEQDLDVESGKANGLRGVFRLGGSWKLRGGWTPLDFRGDAVVGRPFVYGTLVARAGDEAATSFKGNLIEADVEWDFVEQQWGFFGVLGGVRYFDVDTVLVNVTTAARVAETERLPVPVLGLASRAYLGEWLSLEGELSGITAGSLGHLWEWLVALRVHPTDRLALTAGYRSLALEGENDRDFLSLKLRTWTFGLEISL